VPAEPQNRAERRGKPIILPDPFLNRLRVRMTNRGYAEIPGIVERVNTDWSNLFWLGVGCGREKKES
jgi:hypothetical protein